MATFKAVIRKHHQKEDGTFNVKIRITHNRKIKYVATQIWVTKDDLSKSFNFKPNSVFAEKADEIAKDYRKICNNYGEKIKYLSADEVVDLIKQEYELKDGFRLDFLKYGRIIESNLKSSGHEGNSSVYKSTLNVLEDFTNEIDISRITTKFLIEFRDYLIEKGNNSRSIQLKMGVLRAIHNRAKKEYNDEDLGIIRIPSSPFSRIELKKPDVPKKRAISQRDIIKIKEYECKNKTEELAKDAFLLSFYLIGMNSVDLYIVEKMKNGYITYNRTKTKDRRADKAEITIKIEPEAKELIKKYKDPFKTRIFNFHNRFANHRYFNKSISNGIIAIREALKIDDLEFYSARHSWATIARNECGISKDIISLCLNHSSENNVTDSYLKKDQKLIDDANRKVLDFVFAEKE